MLRLWLTEILMGVKESRKVFGIPILIVSLLLCLVCLGCVSARRIANRALEAPNQHTKVPKKLKKLDTFLATNFPIERIEVGPPAATLELAVLQPGDYGAKLHSTIQSHAPKKPNGKPTYDFSFTWRVNGAPNLETNDIRGTIFLLHGYGLNKETMLPWGLVLAEAGYRVMLVDLRGHGRSTGDRIYFGGIERTDMVQCLNALTQWRVYKGPVGVLGISYGAVVALQWAAIDPRVQSVVAISPYLNPYLGVERYLETFAPHLTSRTDRKVAADVAARLARFPDLATETAVRRIRHPILFIRGQRDEICFREDLNRLQSAAPPGSKVVEVPLANHMVVGMCISQLRGPVTEWFHRQLTP